MSADKKSSQPLPDDNLSFGELAIQAKFVSRKQVEECLGIQRKMVEMGISSKPIGQILYDKKYLSSEQAQKIFRQQSTSSDGNAVIAGFRILKKLGEGSMGTVYKAQQMSMDRPVALKTINLRYSKNVNFHERFFREAQAVAMLNHENIVAGYDVGEECGIAYFAMEYVDGPTVQKILDRSQVIHENIAMNIVIQIARALAHACSHGMVHRDIKPDNIMISKTGIAKLCDLGLAKVPADVGSGGRIVGTPLFISPEQAQGKADVDIRSDIYSLGASFFYMVTGRVPFTGDSASAVLNKHIKVDVDIPEEVSAAVSHPVSEAILIMMEKNPADRFQTPEELIEDLQELLRGRDERAASKRGDQEKDENKLVAKKLHAGQLNDALKGKTKKKPGTKPVKRYKFN